MAASPGDGAAQIVQQGIVVEASRVASAAARAAAPPRAAALVVGWVAEDNFL